jgi:hypothetical protein
MRILFLDDARLRHELFARIHGADEVVHVFTSRDATRALDGDLPFDLVHLDHDLAEKHYLELSGGLRETSQPGDPTYDPEPEWKWWITFLRCAPIVDPFVLSFTATTRALRRWSLGFSRRVCRRPG